VDDKKTGPGEAGQSDSRSASIEAQTSFPNLGENAPVGLVLLDKKGLINTVNPMAVDMLGKRPQKLLHQPFAAFIAPEYGQIWQRCVSEVMRDDGPKACELMLINGGGPPLAVRADCRHVPGDVETPLRVALVDLSVPMISGYPFPETLELYRNIFENITDLYYRTDADGRLEMISPSCLPQTGYSREELLGQPVTDFYAYPAEREGLLKRLQQDGRVNDYEIILVHRDGSHRVASATSRMLYDEDGNPAGVEGILRDVTARKRSQERLAMSEERYRLLFEQAADYVLVLEPNDDNPPIIVDANQAALDKHGYTAEQMFGQPITFLDDSVTKKTVVDRLHRLQSGERIIFESVHRCRDGSSFPAEVVARQAQVGGRTIIFTVERDITTRKENERLQGSLLIENRKLIRRLMEVQEEERHRLARELHDELGQLLTGINARAEYITRHAGNKEIGSAAVDILNATKTLFEAAYATRMQLRPASLDTLGLSAALGELADQWEKQSGMDCSLHIEGNPDSLDDTYAITIYRIVQEGLTNAHRHGQASHVTVTIQHVPPKEDKEGLVKVEIGDNGKGLHVPTMHRGMGIIGMRERVVALEGNFHFTGIPGDGVRIEATLPLGRKEKDQ
jgi:PAS domain S-box-containing protein